MTQATLFDPLSCPLSGSNLLEASAGTGKTFSLTFLYLRLLLEKSLLVDEILVTTFTKAATAELRERIYRQLVAAARIVDELSQRGEVSASLISRDALLVELIQQLVGHDASVADRCQHLTKQLRLALAQFDHAQIHSIDGFALQQLKTHADVLESYIPESSINDDQAIIKQVYLQLAADDFAILGEDANIIGQVVTSMSSEALLLLLTQMIANLPALENAEAAVLACAEENAQLVQQAVNADHDGAVAQIADAIAQDALKKTSYKLDKLHLFAAGLSDERRYCKGDKACLNFLQFFSLAKLNQNIKKGYVFEFSHPLFTFFDSLVERRDGLVSQAAIVNYRVLMHLCRVMQPLIDDAKAEQMSLTFADITRVVADRAELIHSPFKAALIDEAQDTNSNQIMLFEKLFMSDHAKDKICFFVGDPKQAIYGFRGANIYSYMAIQQRMSQHYILSTNFRSSQALNASVNAFFSREYALGDIAYTPVQSHQDNGGSSFADKSLVMMETNDKTVGGLANAAAEYLAQLLQSNYCIENKKLACRDIAVLVRTDSQAETIKAALSAHGLAASFVGKKSVYDTPEAKLMFQLLQVIASDDVRLLRGLLLTPLFNATPDTVRDTQYVNAIRKACHDAAGCYESKGFSVMFYRLFEQLGIAGRLLQADNGRRRLTNMIQLFELLQSVLQTQSLSLFGLCDWLANRIHDDDKESQLRLEDDHAIAIMTIHKAKGLEFPVVCLPFFDHHREHSQTGDAVIVSHKENKATLRSLNNPDLKDWHQSETEAENRRLAYVALTRAKYCNIVVSQSAAKPKTNNKAKSMFSVLLGDGADQERITQANFTQHEMLEHKDSDLGDGIDILPAAYHAKTAHGQYHSAWQLDSFSRLLSLQHHDGYRQVTRPTHLPSNLTTLLAFPAGPRAGTALHEMYEHYMQYRQVDTAFVQMVEHCLRQQLPDVDPHTLPTPEALAKAVADTAAIQLAPLGFCLDDIDVTQQSIEMKFFMHLPPSARQYLYRRFDQSPQSDQTAGFVHGYIDYCFAYQGKYYVLDYKSNQLGWSVNDYNHDAMHAEMLAHQYHQQALIYTVALCKHLGIKTVEQFDEKIGGYVYLFIRGMSQASDCSKHGVYYNRWEWCDIVPLLVGA